MRKISQQKKLPLFMVINRGNGKQTQIYKTYVKGKLVGHIQMTSVMTCAHHSLTNIHIIQVETWHDWKYRIH